MKTLIHFRHGLGDAIQFTCVLAHLRKYRPQWTVDVSTFVGKHSAFHGLCNKVFVQGRDAPPCCQYQQRFDLDWHECHTSYNDSPSTKAEKCLREDLGIKPDPALCRYTIHRGEKAMSLARTYLERVCKTGPGVSGKCPAVLIHYEGNSSADRKNVPVEIIRRLCADILELGFVPIILDWDFRTPLADPLPTGEPSGIHCPTAREELWGDTGTGDAEVLAALIELTTLMIGVDSGPLHTAAATSTPTIGVWTHHHPLHYFGHADNVMHLVPNDHASRIRGDRPIGASYFAKHYRHQIYHDLEDALRVAVRSRLAESADGLVLARDFWIRSDNGEQDLVIVHDIAEQDSYRIDEIDEQVQVVVDVGAHIGCFSKRLHQRHPGAKIYAIECCPENIPVLTKNVASFATVVPAAVTYEPDVALLNAVYSHCTSTGGSTLVSRPELQKQVAAHEVAERPGGEMPSEYWADFRDIRTVTLEDLMDEYGFDRIDVLKLDCEKSEFSILGGTRSIDRIGLIVGEYHGKERFEQLVADRFAGWELRILQDGETGTFWLTRGVGFQPAVSGVGFQPVNTASPTRNVIDGVKDRARVEKDPRLRFGPVTPPGQHAAAHQNGQHQQNGDLAPPRTPPAGLNSLVGFRDQLSTALHPSDASQLDEIAAHYHALFKLINELMPRRVVEIGVGAGYSAFTMFLANPSMTVIGIDTENDQHVTNTNNGQPQRGKHAADLLKEFDFHLLIADSHDLRRLPQAHLIHINADRSFKACLSDLRLAQRSTDRIVVDGYRAIPSVRQACDTFTSEHPEFRRRLIDSDFLVLERKGMKG